MSKSGKRTGVTDCLLLLAATYVQAQDQVCYVNYSYMETQSQVLSGIYRLGEFDTSFADEAITKSFKHDESNLTVNVGVEYLSDIDGNKNAGVRLAIAFSGKPENVFEEVGRAEAEGGGPMKNFFLLSKSVEAGNRIWKFSLSCGPNRKRVLSTGRPKKLQ